MPKQLVERKYPSSPVPPSSTKDNEIGVVNNSLANQPLPDDWIIVQYDGEDPRKKGLEYYFNTQTQESQWNYPWYKCNERFQVDEQGRVWEKTYLGKDHYGVPKYVYRVIRAYPPPRVRRPYSSARDPFIDGWANTFAPERSGEQKHRLAPKR